MASSYGTNLLKYKTILLLVRMDNGKVSHTLLHLKAERCCYGADRIRMVFPLTC